MSRQLLLVAIACSAVFFVPSFSLAQLTGTCEYGTATQRLDINGVSAAMYNTGQLFWGGSGPHYNVPVGSKSNALFLTSLWIGGLVDGEVRMTGTDYGPPEMWPGPIVEDGQPPVDCSDYDRIYKVSRFQIQELDRTEIATQDILDWPWELGAPVVDADGNPDNYDITAGDRPMIEGDQTVWWVMNDLGNEHNWLRAKPLGIEARVTAFAVSSPDPDLNYTTFYRYQLGPVNTI